MPAFSSAVKEFLAQHTTGRLATATPSGVPHVTAVSYVSAEGNVYICTVKSSKKARNVRKNRRVAFIVDDEGGSQGWRYVTVEGVGEPVTDAHEFGVVRDMLYAKYPSWEGSEFRIDGDRDTILVIRPHRVLTANIA